MGIFSSDKPKKKDSDRRLSELLEFRDELLGKKGGGANSIDIESKFNALWSLLKDKLQLEDDDLNAYLVKVEEQRITERSEVPEGDPDPCPKCGRLMSKSKNICLYCGPQE